MLAGFMSGCGGEAGSGVEGGLQRDRLKFFTLSLRLILSDFSKVVFARLSFYHLPYPYSGRDCLLASSPFP